MGETAGWTMTQPVIIGDATLGMRKRALFGERIPATARGKALWQCRNTRALRAWITPGAYAWWIFTDQLKAQQRNLLELRRR